MGLKSFLKLVEIQTKVASVIPFAIGTFYALYRFRSIDISNLFLMLLSLLAIDMATTALNNYQDYKKAHIRHGFGYESHNAIVRDSLREPQVKSVIVILLAVAVLFGFLLFIRTDLTVLAVGGLSFIFAIAYSYGPVPISRTPLGELFSGGFMGYVIPFLAVHIHLAKESLAYISIEGWKLTIAMNMEEMLFLLLVTMPAITGIANIMLANNICDMAEDQQNRRQTLPIMIGRERALHLYRILYIAGAVALMPALVLGVLPVFSIAVFIVAIPVHKNIKIFMMKQTKEETFVSSVKNFIMINTVLAATIGLGAIFA